MLATNMLNRQAEALEHLLGYRTAEQRHEPAQSSPSVSHFTIALARQAGTPALEVAREVGQRLGWQVYDQELPQAIARELHLPASFIEAIDERRQNWLLEFLGSFTSDNHLSESRYFHCLISVIRSLGAQGSCVIVGRGAEFVLPPCSTLRVRLVADRADRIRDFSRRLQLDHWMAARRVEEINRERSRFLSEHFHLDPTKARHYDLVLNTSRWSPADCADLILEALHHKEVGYQTE